MSDKKQEAVLLMLAPLRTNDQLLMATSAYEKCKRYQTMYHAAVEARRQNPGLEGKLASHVAATLFEGEVHLRAFFKEALVSVNALRDSGMMENVLREGITQFAKDDGMSRFEEALSNAEDKIKASNKEISLAFLTEARSLFKQHVRSMQSSQGQLHFSAVLGEEERLLALEPTPRPGHFGRIEWQQFFDPRTTGTSVVALQLTLANDSCHSRRLAKDEKENASRQIVDLYGSIVAGMAAARESVYWLARRTSEVGLGAFEGRDPVTGVLIGLGITFLVAGAVCVIVGICTGDWSLILVGIILMLLGGALIVGGLDFYDFAHPSIAPNSLPVPADPDIPLEDIPSTNLEIPPDQEPVPKKPQPRRPKRG